VIAKILYFGFYRGVSTCILLVQYNILITNEEITAGIGIML